MDYNNAHDRRVEHLIGIFTTANDTYNTYTTYNILRAMTVTTRAVDKI